MVLYFRMNLFVILKMQKRTGKYERTEGICCDCMREKKGKWEGGFRLTFHCHLPPWKKKNKGQKNTARTELLSGYYSNRKAIIVPCHSLWKGFSWQSEGWEEGKRGERGGKRERGRLTIFSACGCEMEWDRKNDVDANIY